MKAARFFAVASALFAACYASAQMDVKPPAELKALEWMVGEWSGKVTWEMPGTPKMETEMTFKNYWEGPFLRSDSSMEMMGAAVIEKGYIAYDAEKKRLTAWTFTNFGAMPRIEHGSFEDGKYVVISEPWNVEGAPAPIISRGTMVKKSDTESDFTLEFKSGETWNKVAWATFKKKS